MICNSLEKCPYCRDEIEEIKKIKDTLNSYLTDNGLIYETIITNITNRSQYQVKCCAKLFILLILLVLSLVLHIANNNINEDRNYNKKFEN